MKSCLGNLLNINNFESSDAFVMNIGKSVSKMNLGRKVGSMLLLSIFMGKRGGELWYWEWLVFYFTWRGFSWDSFPYINSEIQKVLWLEKKWCMMITYGRPTNDHLPTIEQRVMSPSLEKKEVWLLIHLRKKLWWVMQWFSQRRNCLLLAVMRKLPCWRCRETWGGWFLSKGWGRIW